MKHLRAALEGETVDLLEASTPLPMTDEELTRMSVEKHELVAASLYNDAQIDRYFGKTEELSVGMESLYELSVALEAAIVGGQCTTTTLSVFRLSASQHASRLGVALPTLALESEGTLEHQHQLALEGVRDAILKLAQAYVIEHKRQGDFIARLVTTNKMEIKRQRNLITKALAEYDQKQATFKDSEHTGSLAALWRFFQTEEKLPDDPLQAVQDDLQFSQFALVNYPQALLGLQGQLATAVNAAQIKGPSDALALANRVQAMKHPFDLFKPEYTHEGFQLLGVISTEVVEGVKRSSVVLNEKVLDKLALLAKSKYVKESGSKLHKVLSAVGRESSIQALFAQEFKYQTGDIQSMLRSGLQYLDHAEHFLSYAPRIDAASKTMAQAFESLAKSAKDSDGAAEITAMLRQVQQYGENISQCLQQPAQAELTRAIRAARYCQYIGLRMIFNAK